MKSLTFLPLAALSLAAPACDPPAPAATTAASVSPLAAPPAAPASTAGTSTPGTTTTLPARPAPAADALASFARGNNAFGLDVYGKIRGGAGNLAFAPVSLSTALATTWMGAGGETAAQMKKVLHAEGTPEQMVDTAGRVVSALGADGKVTLRVANRLFGEQRYPFARAFLDRQKALAGAPLEQVDFLHDSEGARKRINDWVAGETQNRVEDLVPKGGVDPDSRLVLTNAVYFKGDWMTPFDKAETRPEPFHVTGADTKTVPTMHENARLRFAAVEGVKVVDLPYEGGAVTMTLVLPDAADGLAALEARLSPAALDLWIKAEAMQRVDVALPKVEIDPQGSIALGDTLKELGMPLAFDPARADFLAMGDASKKADPLYIARVFHKAFVKMDEKGTEAAAASAVVMADEAAVAANGAAFRADHPYLFFLRDASSGMVLFMGRVADPSAK